jgi:hypothetical protein
VRWIFEGGHSTTWTTRLARADTVVWLDLPLALRLWRLTRRSIFLGGGQWRPDLPEGGPERFCPETLRFWAYIGRTRISGRDLIVRLLAGVPDRQTVVHLRSQAEVAAHLSELT